jgi:hypothetical protein
MASTDAWTKAQTEEFIRATNVSLSNPALSGQERALLEAERDGARAWLRYLAAVEVMKAPAEVAPSGMPRGERL